MSDNIPIDILDAANSAYMMQLEMGEEAVTAGEHKNIMVIEIAKAIYAERLRCAEIAKTSVVEIKAMIGSTRQDEMTRSAIISAIMDGNDER